MRFKLDENLPAEASTLLRAEGHDAMSVLEQDLGGTIDSRLAEICTAEDRVLLTFDIDFADIRAYPPQASAGIIVFRLKAQDRASFIRALNALLAILGKTPPTQQLWIVEENRVRIRE